MGIKEWRVGRMAIQEILSSDDVEFPFLDDCPMPIIERGPEAVKYDPYRVPPAPNGCGGNLDQYG